MTLWKNLVVALVAAFVLAACSSSDNDPAPTDTDTGMEQTGPTQAELDAAEKDKADAEAEAEAQKKRADELQAEKEREQAKDDLATAKALFAVLQRTPLAILGEDATTAEHTFDVTNRDTDSSLGLDQVTVRIPVLGESDDSGMVSKTSDARVTTTVYRDSTKGDDTSKPFGEKYDIAQDGMISLTGTTDSDDMDTVSATNNKKIESSSFPQESGTLKYEAGKRQFSGTFDGAPGTYACVTPSAGGICSAEFNLGGGITLVGEWKFDPDDGAKTRTEDARFQTFGWWLQKNSRGDIVDAGPVHITTGLVPAAAVVALQGTATYKGSAAGKYAIYSGAFSERSEAGHFTANATLKADFGNADDGGNVSGTIDKFATVAGNKDWKVEFKASTVLANSTEFSGATVWTIGDIASDARGQYFGGLYDEDTEDTVPHEAGGEFWAPFEAGVGRMIGAFAATREPSK